MKLRLCWRWGISDYSSADIHSLLMTPRAYFNNVCVVLLRDTGPVSVASALIGA